MFKPPSANLRLFLGISALFFFIGPPVGAIAFSLLGAAGAIATGSPDGIAAMIFHAGLFAVLLSWLVGGVPALLAGAATALFTIATRRISLLAAMGAGALVAVPSVVEQWDAGLPFLALLVGVHLAAALVCGLIARAHWGVKV